MGIGSGLVMDLQRPRMASPAAFFSLTVPPGINIGEKPSSLGSDVFGNIQRLDNTLGAFEERMAACVEQLENTRVQLENAKAEVQKPFPQEEELAAKTARLNELNALLNLDKTENEIVDAERGEEEPQRTSSDRER